MKRKSRKRSRHEFQKFSPEKGKDVLLVKGENINKGALNIIEHFLLRATVNNLLLRKDPALLLNVGSMYNDAVQVMHQDEVLAKIPVSTHDNARVKTEERKIMLKDDKLDQLE